MPDRVIIGVRPLPLGMTDLGKWSAALEAEHPGGHLKQIGGHLVAVAGEGHDPTECWCARCAHAVADAIYGPEPDDDDDPHYSWSGRFIATSRMYLCHDCGNKRCPRATWHVHTCTGSNDTGQAGSDYGDPDAPTAPHDPEVDRG